MIFSHLPSRMERVAERGDLLIGDIRLAIIRWWRQLWCHHDYRWHLAHVFPEFYYQECSKCGRTKF